MVLNSFAEMHGKDDEIMPYKIEFKKDHTNSKGESAPWVIVNEDRNEIVGSSQTKETAESSIRARLAGEHGGFKNKS
jgi:hypothetical protein